MTGSTYCSVTTTEICDKFSVVGVTRVFHHKSFEVHLSIRLVLRLESLEFLLSHHHPLNTSVFVSLILHCGDSSYYYISIGGSFYDDAICEDPTGSLAASRIITLRIGLEVRGSLIPVATRASHYLAMGTDIIFYRHLWQAVRERFLPCWVMR